MSSRKFSFQQPRGRSSNVTSPSVSASNSVMEAFSIGENKATSSQTTYSLDFQLINQKMHDLSTDNISSVSNTPLPSPNASSFVHGMRSLATFDPNDDKSTQQQKLLDKIAELDRLVLRKTSYHETNEGTTPIRRKQGSDLHIIPTHMQIVDRLLDFYSHLKRPHVDHSDTLLPSLYKSGKGTTPRPTLKVTGESLATSSSRAGTIPDHHYHNYSHDKLVKLYEDSESKCRSFETENMKLRKKVQGLSSEVSSLKEKISTQTQIRSPASAAVKYDEEIQSLRTELHNTREQHQTCLSGIYAMLEKKATIIGATRSDGIHTSYEMNYNNYPLTHDIREAMLMLDDNLNKRFAEHANEVDALHETQSMITAKMKAYQDNDMMHHSNMMNHDAENLSLRTTLEALEATSIAAQKKYTTESNEKIFNLHQELRASHMKILSLEYMNTEVSQMNERLLLAEQEKIACTSMIVQLRDEIDAYQRLNDSLKDKIRHISTSSQDGKEFLETFEEVMRNEMMTMKTAFEAKLRAARDEADALSRKHLMEITRMKQSSAGMLASTTTPVLNKSLSDKVTRK